jgi:hypothetical protein
MAFIASIGFVVAPESDAQDAPAGKQGENTPGTPASGGKDSAKKDSAKKDSGGRDTANKDSASKKGEKKDSPAPAEGKAAEPEPPASDSSSSEDTEDDEKLKSIDEMPLPSIQRFLNGPPVDWLVTRDRKVIEIEPIQPRPRYVNKVWKRTVDLRVDEMIAFNAANPARPDEASSIKSERSKLLRFEVVLLPPIDENGVPIIKEKPKTEEGAIAEEEEEEEALTYRILTRDVREIVHYEDLILRRVDQCLDAGDVNAATDLLAIVLRRVKETEWPGLPDRLDRASFVEAENRYKAGDNETCLALLDGLLQRKPSYDGAQRLYSACVAGIVHPAIENQQWRRARFFLSRLNRWFRDNSTVQELRARIIAAANARKDAALAARSAGNAALAAIEIDQAARIWPELPDLRSLHAPITHEHQRLLVGVIDRPAANPALPNRPADERRRDLTSVSLFEPVRIDDRAVRYSTRFFDEWEPTELGLGVRLRFRRRRAAWESLAPVSTSAAAELFAEMLDPNSSRFDERFASAVSGIAIRGSDELALTLNSAPLRLESLFAVPVPSTLYRGSSESGTSAILSAALDSTTPEAAASIAHKPEITYPFRFLETVEGRTDYTRTVPQPRELSPRQVVDVVERVYRSRDLAVQGFLRGETAMLADPGGWNLKPLRDRNEFAFHTLQVPAVYVLEFNPRTTIFQNRNLRRSLATAIDVPRILRETVLHGRDENWARPSTAPFARASYATDPGVVPYAYNLSVSLSLLAAARRELKTELPELRVRVSDDAEAIAAVQRIAADLGRCGLKIRVDSVNESTANDDDWDIRYVSHSMFEPLTELWPCLTQSPNPSLDSIRRFPQWMRQELLNLDRVGDWSSARSTLQRLHRQIHAEVLLIPLWEVDRVIVARKEVRGIPAAPARVYDSMERWSVESWWPRD